MRSHGKPGADSRSADPDAEKDKRRLELLKAARRESGMSLDFWEDFTQDLDNSALEILVGRSSVFPKYMKSSGSE